MNEKELKGVARLVKSRGARTISDVLRVLEADQELLVRLVDTKTMSGELMRRTGRTSDSYTRTYYTGSEIDAMVDLRRKGQTWRQIGAATGRDPSGIRLHVLKRDPALR